MKSTNNRVILAVVVAMGLLALALVLDVGGPLAFLNLWWEAIIKAGVLEAVRDLLKSVRTNILALLT